VLNRVKTVSFAHTYICIYKFSLLITYRSYGHETVARFIVNHLRYFNIVPIRSLWNESHGSLWQSYSLLLSSRYTMFCFVNSQLILVTF